MAHRFPARQGAWLLALVTSLGCTGEASAPADDGPPSDDPIPTSRPSTDTPVLQLQDASVVAIPDTTEATAWLGQVQKLDIDPASERVLAMQGNRGNVVEFTVTGDLAVVYGGRRGQGPGEISRLVDFAVTPDAVALLDRGNSRVLVYDRAGRLQSEFPVSPYHRSIDFLQSDVVLLPGEEDTALDLFDVSGEKEQSIGLRSDLPIRCDVDGCIDRSTLCRGCDLVVAESRILVVNRDQSIITAFDREGAVAWKTDYVHDDELVAAWAAADEPDRARMEKEQAARGRGRTEVLKSYFLHADAAEDGLVTLAVVPSGDEFKRSGYEVWRLNPQSGSYRRYRYPRLRIGFLAVGSEARGFIALDPGSGGVYRFAAPDGP